jgi:signal transduction histidine kinase
VAQKLVLRELVSQERLETLQRQFESVTGVRMVFTDAEGVPVTAVAHPLCFCGSLVRSPDGGTVCLRRKQWDVPEPEIEAEIRAQHSQAEPIAHRCRGRFRDTAAHIVVEGQTIGHVVFGRTLTEEPELGRFRQLAVEGGMLPEVGEQVALHAHVVGPERLESIAGLVQNLATLLAGAAYDTLRARRILELEHLRDSLIHMIVHDLRTPLTGIIGSLHTLKDTGCEVETCEYVTSMALQSSEELLEMVNTLLDIHKMESGESILGQVVRVDFADLAREAIAQVQALLEDYDQHLSVDVTPGSLVETDPDLLRRVLVNLLGNAIKFTPQGGAIGLTGAVGDAGLVFSVSDSGPGISVEDQIRIFEKFGQAQARSEGRKNSTGLGLTFCRMVANAHGGHINLTSEVGRGSTFTVFIPHRRSPAA